MALISSRFRLLDIPEGYINTKLGDNLARDRPRKYLPIIAVSFIV